MNVPILVDCDEVLSDFVGAVLTVAEEDFGRTHTREDVTGWDIEKALGVPGLMAAVERWIGEGLCRNLAAVPGARDFLTHLEHRYGADNVLVVTSPWNAVWLPQRAAWLEDFGVPQKRQIQTKAPKRHIKGFLIDDGPHNLLERPMSERFCIAAPWNADVLGPRGGYAECLAYMADLTRFG